MEKYNNNEESNRIMEVYYASIGRVHINNIAKELESKKEEIEKIELPASLDAWVEEYARKEIKEKNRKKRLSSIKKFSKRAAIFIIVLMSAMTTLMFTVEAVRIRVLNFFIEINEKYTEVRVNEVTEDNITPVLEWENYYIPEYTPDRYFYEGSVDGGLIKILKYNDGENQIIFTQARNGTSIQLDTEDAVVSTVMIDGTEGQLIIKGDRVMLFWYNDDKSFTITGYVSEDEVIRMMESLEKAGSSSN